jgi:adenylate kinase
MMLPYAQAVIKRLLFLGGPGVGKGTQAAMLCQRNTRYVALSTGDLLRDQIKNEQQLGQKSELLQLISQGKLVPNEMVMATLVDGIGQLRKSKIPIIDGFMRESAQLDLYQDVWPEPKETLAIYFESSVDLLKQRLLSRKQGRLDDTKEAINQRLEIFEQTTLPAIERTLNAYPSLRIDATSNANVVNDKLLIGLERFNDNNGLANHSMFFKQDDRLTTAIDDETIKPSILT